MEFYNITILLYFDQINAALKLSIRDLQEKTLSIPNFRMLVLRANECINIELLIFCVDNLPILQ